MDKVEIEWKDAGTCDSQVPLYLAGEHTLIEARCMGYMVNEDKEQITLAMGYFPEIEQVKFLFVIPRSAIKKIRKLGKV